MPVPARSPRPTRSARDRLALALLAVGLLAAPALGAPMALYTTHAAQHDDQGRSDEPDFMATSALGPPVMNRVVSPALNHVGVPDSALPPPAAGQAKELAPGCTDDLGRRVSGLCGLWTIGGLGGVPPPHTVGVPGMTGSAAPGRLTPTKAAIVEFLDARLDFKLGPGGSNLDINHKLLADSGVAAFFAAVDPAWGSPFVVGPTAVWAWHGRWADKNGNGVIDHITRPSTAANPCPAPAAGESCVTPENEFVWHGSCKAPGGAPNPNAATNGYCKAVYPNARILGWAFPGGHNAYAVPDAGLLMYACLAPWGYVFTPQCAQHGPFPSAKDAQGDWLVERQFVVKHDWDFLDQTGSPDPTRRGWHVTDPNFVAFYDQSLLNSLLTVSAVNPAPGGPNDARYETAPFADVDVHRAWSPLTETLLRTVVKPLARSVWQVPCTPAYGAANCFP